MWLQKVQKHNTAGLVIQSIISRLLDENNYILTSSVGLTDAFDLVDVEHLTKQLYTVGLPRDIVKLIKLWHWGRAFVVNMDGGPLSCLIFHVT